MNDFEARLEKLLNEQVDAQVGPRRPAPPHRFDTQSAPRSSRARVRWLPPLLAAACVALIVGGGVAGTQLLSSDRTPAGPHTGVPTMLPAPGTTAVATPTPTAAPPTPTHPSTHRPAPQTQGSVATVKTGSTAPAAPAATHTVQLGAASISLPAGWVARDYQRYMSHGASPLSPSWCLTPASEPVSTKPYGCPMTLSVPTVHENPLDVDIQGGYASNPEYCGQNTASVDEQSGDRTLGGRAADWRHWRLRCGDGSVRTLEQYEVPAGPAYILFSERVDTAIHDAMTGIAAHSTLPAQTDPLRWMDRGYIRSVHRAGNSVHITLDRVVSARTVLNKNPATYPYTVPLSEWKANGNKLRVGSLVYLQTDGRKVVNIYES